MAAGRWQRQDFASAVVDCRQGLDHIERDLWTNNRRNERNRGLKRGCTLHSEPTAEALAAWYPLYEAKAHQWAQAPVPQAFLADLLAEHPDRACFDHVRLDGQVVAGHVCFISRRRLVAWQGAVRPDLARTHFLTTLLYWRNLMTACERGLEAVDFGGNVGRDSLWDFKRRCGAVAEPRTQLLRLTAAGRAHAWLARLARRGAKAAR
jgi:predicted N-acyltransferase